MFFSVKIVNNFKNLIYSKYKFNSFFEINKTKMIK